MSAAPSVPALELRIARAFVAACGDELAALKPGNVHRYADGHGMQVADFVASADCAAPELARRGSTVGQRILGAVSACHAKVDCNTNLGIILLCAPLACAAEGLPPNGGTSDDGALSTRLAQVLDSLDTSDAEAAFRAIALANPGGLGSVPIADVHGPASVGLREAMALAAARDRVAMQYITDYADIFVHALPCLEKLLAEGHGLERATTGLFLFLLARWPDTHLLRKFGDSVAHSVTQEAGRFHEAFCRTKLSPKLFDELLDWDSRLKTQGLNPGTTADLTVATLFLHRLGMV
jgi:triphosphoribosyl-dephospho-CoA synthase